MNVHEIGRKKIRLDARRIDKQGVEKDRILLAIEDVPEKEWKMAGKDKCTFFHNFL